MSCNRPASAWVSGRLPVVASRATLQGSFFVYGTCASQATTWTATVTAQNGRFKSGKADLIASGSASDNYSNASGDAQGPIHLRAKKK